MKKYFKYFLQISIYLIVLFFLYKLLHKDIEKNILNLHFNKIQLVYIFLALLFYCSHVILNAYNWYILINRLGYKADLFPQIGVFIKSLILRYIPGSVVGILSRGILNKPYKVPVIISLWGWFLENFIYLIVGILLGSFVLKKEILQNYTQDKTFVFFVVFIFVFSFLLIWKLDYFEYLFRKYVISKLKINTIIEQSLDINNSLKFNVSNKNKLELFLRYCLSWILYSIAFYFVTLVFYTPNVLDIFMLFSMNAAAWSIGYMSLVTPSGTGVREAIFGLTLPLLGMSHLQAVLIAFLSRFLIVISEVLCLTVYNIVGSLRKKQDFN